MSGFLIIVAIAAACIVLGAVGFAWWFSRRTQSNGVTVDVERLLADGRYDAAKDVAISALSVETDQAECFDLRICLARALVGEEDYQAAERVCREAADFAPASRQRADALVEIARVQALAGELDAASETLQSVSPMACSADGRGRRELAIADIALTRLRFAEAERALAAAYDPSQSAEIADDVALAHARLQYLRGNFRQAIAETTRLLDRFKNEDSLSLTLLTLARALLDQERPEPVEADRALSKALVLVHFPGYASVVSACHALVQAHFDNEKEALESADRASKLCVSSRFAAEAECLIGDAMRQFGRYVEARKHYQRALGLDAGSLEALWGLATCAQMTGLYQVAEPYFKLCIEAAPEHFLGRRSEDAIEG